MSFPSHKDSEVGLPLGEDSSLRVVPGVAGGPRGAGLPRGFTPRVEPTPQEIAGALLEGNRSALSRAITLIESNAPRHRPQARELLEILSSSPGQALRIGISGVPGAGKSTFIEAFGNVLCDQGHKVAVLAVDPSSTRSRGSILGDKTRMETLSRREECFIRPSPTSGALGGVTRKTRETIQACESAGCDVILVETVGVGQSEIAVHSMVDIFVLVLISGAGDEIQGIKKGIVEIADLLVVNKADGSNRPSALATRAQFEQVMHFLTPGTAIWTPPVLAASAIERTGVSEVWQTIQTFEKIMKASGAFEARRRSQAVEWWRALVDQEWRARLFANAAIAQRAHALEEDVSEGKILPSLAAEKLLEGLKI